MSSRLNKPGYSQHLLAVEVMLRRPAYGDSDELRRIAVKLAEKPENEGNAFFANLTGKDRAEVIRQTLDRCPSPENIPSPPFPSGSGSATRPVGRGCTPATGSASL